jgi:hypothetical protein
MEREEIAEEIQAIIDGFDLDTGVDGLRRGLNAFMKNLWHIPWWGQFKELTHGRGTYAKSIRRDFFQQDTGLPPAVEEDRLAEFKEFLRTYGV